MNVKNKESCISGLLRCTRGWVRCYPSTAVERSRRPSRLFHSSKTGRTWYYSQNRTNGLRRQCWRLRSTRVNLNSFTIICTIPKFHFRVFVSGLNEKMAQRFFNLLLLPRIRDDIDTYQRLNFHLYQALKKALFKPGVRMQFDVDVLDLTLYR